MANSNAQHSAVLAFSFIIPPKSKAPSNGYNLMKAAGSIFNSDKLPEVWISISAPTIRDSYNKASPPQARETETITFREVWRAGKVTPRLNMESLKALPEQKGKACGVASWSVPFFVPEQSAPCYLVAIHTGTAPPPSYGHRSNTSTSSSSLGYGTVPDISDVSHVSDSVASTLSSMQNILAYTLLSSAHLNALKDGSSTLPLSIGCLFTKGKYYERGAALLVSPLPLDTLKHCRNAMGPLSAPPNQFHPLHHTYVYKKEPLPSDELLPLAPPCLLEFNGSKPNGSNANSSMNASGVQFRTTKPDLIVATESSFEVAPCFLLPVLLLRPTIDALEKVNIGWTDRRELEAMSQGCITDETHASQFVALHITVNRARFIQPLPTVCFAEDDNSQVDIGAESAAPSTFVDIIYDSPVTRLHAITLGRTNTEYITHEPIFGCNAHSHHCKHNKPEMTYHVTAPCVELEKADDVSQELVSYWNRDLSAPLRTTEKGKHPDHQGVVSVPQKSTFAIQIPKHEVETAVIHFRVIEERVVKVKGKRENVLAVNSTLSVKLNHGLKLSENPKNEEECCACWYPLDTHTDSSNNRPPELLVALALAEPLIDELDDLDDMSVRNSSSRVTTVANSGVGDDAASGGGGGEEEAEEDDDDAEDDDVQEVDDEVKKAFIEASPFKFKAKDSPSSSGCSGCDAFLNLLNIKPSPLVDFINKDSQLFGSKKIAIFDYSTSLLNSNNISSLTDLSAILLEEKQASSSSSTTTVDLLDVENDEKDNKTKFDYFTPNQLYPLNISLRNCDRHLLNMKKQFNTLSRSMQMIESLHDRGRAFRGSKLKTSLELQPVATNLHVQLFKVEEFGSDGLPKPAAHRRIAEYDYITHGAPTVHALGYSKGGLTELKAELEETRNELTQALHRYVIIRNNHISNLPMLLERQEEALKNGMSGRAGQNLTVGLFSDGEAGQLLQHISKLSLRFEGRASSVAIRIILALSQGLSIVVSSLASKLMIMSFGEGDYLSSSALRWVEHGYLVYLEGLISTQGKEYGMIQDTEAVVDMMREWKVILSTNTDSAKKMDMEASLEDKSVTLKFSPDVYAKLPIELQPGASIPLIPVLFTQGVDIKQSLANRSGSKSGSGPQYQIALNRKSFKIFNLYALKCYGKTIEDNSVAEIHPLCESLAHAIRQQSPTKKNVDVLEEAARATYALGGGITVFCKSGKDRTAMAVTLHQSKALGEYHGCGISPERVFTDASLMRGFGTRIDVANKNTGAYKYSFNALQVSYLPNEWRPPSFTVQGFVTSVIKRDS